MDSGARHWVAVMRCCTLEKSLTPYLWCMYWLAPRCMAVRDSGSDLEHWCTKSQQASLRSSRQNCLAPHSRPATLLEFTSTEPQWMNWTIFRKSSGRYLFTSMVRRDCWRFPDFLAVFVECSFFRISWYITLLRVARMALTPWMGTFVGPTRNVTSQSSGMDRMYLRWSQRALVFRYLTWSPLTSHLMSAPPSPHDWYWLCVDDSESEKSDES